jgi:hypothetical protein
MSQQIQITGGAKVRNLEGVLTGTSGVVNALGINVPSGIPQLDGSGKILVSQLPNSVMEYKGTWNAATNTPTLADGTGNQGDVYLCNVAGTANFGSGPIAFFVGDQVIYSGTIWQRASGATGTVTSVAVTESGDSLNVTGSPITTSGTINIGFNGNSGQYINGAGNLTTFPSLAGYVTSVTATTPLLSSGGTTPDLSIPAASASVDGYLDNADWTTFNNKQNAITLTTTGTSGVSTLVGSTLNIPNYSTDLSGYVPYTGATANVNLGTFDLTADVITGATGSFASSGGSNTFAINHSSGSGIALNITKGGNGEGLYINKTSGSGNAATIIGTLNATTLVKSGGTSSQFLKADGSVDASAYITLASLSAGAGISYNNTTGVITSTITQYTDALARAAISLTTTGTSGASTYNNTTGVLNVPTYTLAGLGGQPLATNLTSLSGLTFASTSFVKMTAAGTFTLDTNTYALASALGNYLPLAGGTLTGPLLGTTASFSGNIQGAALISSIGASDTIGEGSNYNWNNNIITAGNSRQLALQMNASNGLTLWYYNGTSWGTSTGLNFLNNGRVQSTGFFNTFESTSSRSRNSFQSYNLNESAITGGWIAADFGDRGTTSDRVVIGSGFNNKAILGAHTGILDAWTALFIQPEVATNVIIGGTTDNGAKLQVTSVAGGQLIRVAGASTTDNFISVFSGDIHMFLDADYSNLAGIVGTQSTHPLIFRTNGTNKARISTDGNLLINTATDAGFKLDVNGTARIGDSLTITTPTSATSIALRGRSADNISALRYQSNTGATTYATIYSNASDLIFENNGSARLTISSLGNTTFSGSVQSTRFFNTFAGEGTNNSRNSFQSYNLNETAVTVGWIAADFGDRGTTSARVVLGSGYGNKAVIAGHSGALNAWADLLVNTGGGNMLIGTSTGITGGGVLQVNGNVNINGVFQINGTTIGGGGGSGITGSGTSGYHSKWTSGTSLGNGVLYDDGTRIGLNTTSALTATRFQIDYSGAGNYGIFINQTTSNEATMRFKSTHDANSDYRIGASILIGSAFEIYSVNAANTRFAVASNGNVLINRITDAGYKFDVNGTGRFTGQLNGTDAYFAGSVTATSGFFDTSDSRLKIIVKDYDKAKGIENVEARLYLKNNKKELGYFAQDIKEILPSAVIEGEDGFLTLSYSQVHTAKIAYLEDKVAQLEELIKSLL